MDTLPPPRLSFPCAYPINVMVRAETGVRSHVDAIITRHAGPVDLSTVVERPSTEGRFLSLTYVIEARGEQHIAELFAALKACPQVVLVL